MEVELVASGLADEGDGVGDSEAVGVGVGDGVLVGVGVATGVALGDGDAVTIGVGVGSTVGRSVRGGVGVGSGVGVLSMGGEVGSDEEGGPMMSLLGTTAKTREAANEAKRFRPTMRLANRSAPWSEERRVTIRILCPLGTFQMLAADDGGDANERPAHQARIALLRALLR